MNDRYLHKAKDKDDGKWYEGYYMCFHDTTYCSIPSDNVEEAKKLEEKNTHHYIVFERMTDWGLPNRHLRAEIDPTTLCACTGLKDKNGKLIWENDVVEFEDVGEEGYEYKEGFDFINRAKVEFAEARWSLTDFISTNSSVVDEMYNHVEFMDFWNNCEVIGNIFDNPEMLEVEE